MHLSGSCAQGREEAAFGQREAAANTDHSFLPKRLELAAKVKRLETAGPFPSDKI